MFSMLLTSKLEAAEQGLLLVAKWASHRPAPIRRSILFLFELLLTSTVTVTSSSSSRRSQHLRSTANASLKGLWL